MIGSWKLPALGVVAVVGYVGFFCPACGRGGAESPVPVSGTSTASADATTIETVEFDVAGMTCGGCAMATEVALKRLDGVRSAEASYDEGTGAGSAAVQYDPARISPEGMIEAVEAIGFHPTVRSSGGG